MEANHTMLPWVADGSRIVSEANPKLTIGRVGVSSEGEYSPQNVAFIVRSCNSHYTLRDLLEEAARRVREDPAGDHGLADRIDATLAELAAGSAQ